MFIYDKKLNYTLSSPPAKHTKKRVTVNDSNNKKWLEIKHESIDKSGDKYFLITDHKTSSTLKVNDCKSSTGCLVSLLSPSQYYTAAKGVLIDGCPP